MSEPHLAGINLVELARAARNRSKLRRRDPDPPGPNEVSSNIFALDGDGGCGLGDPASSTCSKDRTSLSMGLETGPG